MPTQAEIKRKREMAQLLRDKSMQGQQGQMVGGVYVPPQATQYAAQLMNAWAGKKNADQADTMETQRNAEMAKLLSDSGINPAYAENPEIGKLLMQKQSQDKADSLAASKPTILNQGQVAYGPDGNVMFNNPKPEPDWKNPEWVETQKQIRAAGKSDINLSKGEEAVDKGFGKEYIDWKSRGGYADAQKNIEQLKEVRNMLASGQELTGPMTGNMPDFINQFANPKAMAARDMVEEVVQRNLRLILGAQFTEKEGERLIARAYNPKLDESENLKRVDRLITAIEQAAQAKEGASNYFQQNGTLKGWKGKDVTIGDLEKAISDDPTQSQGGFSIKRLP